MELVGEERAAVQSAISYVKSLGSYLRAFETFRENGERLFGVGISVGVNNALGGIIIYKNGVPLTGVCPSPDCLQGVGGGWRCSCWERELRHLEIAKGNDLRSWETLTPRSTDAVILSAIAKFNKLDKVLPDWKVKLRDAMNKSKENYHCTVDASLAKVPYTLSYMVANGVLAYHLCSISDCSHPGVRCYVEGYACTTCPVSTNARYTTDCVSKMVMVAMITGTKSLAGYWTPIGDEEAWLLLMAFVYAVGGEGVNVFANEGRPDWQSVNFYMKDFSLMYVHGTKTEKRKQFKSNKILCINGYCGERVKAITAAEDATARQRRIAKLICRVHLVKEEAIREAESLVSFISANWEPGSLSHVNDELRIWEFVKSCKGVVLPSGATLNHASLAKIEAEEEKALRGGAGGV